VLLNLPRTKTPCWLSDATADVQLLEQASGARIADKTPDGHLRLIQPVLQHPVDITRRTSGPTVCGLIRGLIADRPFRHRFGIICHRTHTKPIEALETIFRSRIQRISYFGSGADRAVNSWHHECDAIIVAGTPRVPPEALRKWLCRIGRFDAARRDGDWGALPWKGLTTSDRPRIVEGIGYRDADWREAHRAIVRANIIQAAGRGRGIRETGCEVIVLSTEEAGFTLSEPGKDALELKTGEASVLTAINGQISYISLLGDLSVKSAQIASSTGESNRQVQRHLGELEARGLVRRVGERSGWQLTKAGSLLVDGDDGNTSVDAEAS
jgi:hypothetical protein